MKGVAALLALGLVACSGPSEPTSSRAGFEPAMKAALLERDAARLELERLAAAPRSPLDAWREWRARSRLERVILELDALERRRLEAQTRAMREAQARATAAWEEIDETLRRASRTMRAGDLAAADSLYGRASRLLEARTPARAPEPSTPPSLDPGTMGARALLAERVRLSRRLARLSGERIEVAGTIARLEEDRSRLSGLRRFRGILDRGDPFTDGRRDGPASARESSADRVLEARLAALRAEASRLDEETAGLQAAVERIDAAVTTRSRSGLPAPPATP